MKHSWSLFLTVSLMLMAPPSVSTQAQKQSAQETSPRLGVEIALSKPFYLPASMSGQRLAAFIRVPETEVRAAGREPVSAVRIDPQMRGERVEVTVYAVFGDTSQIYSCKDWNSLRSEKVASYVADLGDKVSMTKLTELGVKFGESPLSFNVVAKKNFAAVGLPTQDGGDCGCGGCGGLLCCPNPGYCLRCGNCGDVCCVAYER